MNLKIHKEHSQKNKMTRLCQEILSKNYDIYLFGTNEWAEDIMNFIDVKGVINEFTNEKYFNGKEIINQLELISKENSIVISCIIGKPWIVKEKLDLNRINNIDYFSFWKYSSLELKDPREWLIFNEKFNYDDYNLLFKKLEDIHSKSVLENILNFRLNMDISNLKFYTDRQIFQYFEPFLSLEAESFIDIGGFDGNTSLQFINYTKNFNQIYFFEPDLINLKVAKLFLTEYSSKINYFNFGLGEKEAKFKITLNGSRSFLSEKGEVEIHVKTLDNLMNDISISLNEKYYLKMDIEGWEMQALIGAKKFISDFKPKMAICVYHKPNDMIDICNYVLSLYSEYKIYLRHYTEGVDETVMYFIP